MQWLRPCSYITNPDLSHIWLRFITWCQLHPLAHNSHRLMQLMRRLIYWVLAQSTNYWPLVRWSQNDISKYAFFNVKFCICVNISSGYSWQYVTIGSGNDLAQSKRQAIAWNNDKQAPRRHVTSPGPIKVVLPHRMYACKFSAYFG